MSVLATSQGFEIRQEDTYQCYITATKAAHVIELLRQKLQYSIGAITHLFFKYKQVPNNRLASVHTNGATRVMNKFPAVALGQLQYIACFMTEPATNLSMISKTLPFSENLPSNVFNCDSAKFLKHIFYNIPRILTGILFLQKMFVCTIQSATTCLRK